MTKEDIKPIIGSGYEDGNRITLYTDAPCSIPVILFDPREDGIKYLDTFMLVQFKFGQNENTTAIKERTYCIPYERIVMIELEKF